MCVIYKISNPKGHIYIGQTIDFERRLAQYKNGGSQQQKKLFLSFKKYGFQAHKIEIIESVDRQLLTPREIYWISFYDSFNRGLNCTIGGNYFNFTEEIRKKLSLASKGKKKSPQHVINQVNARKRNGTFTKTKNQIETHRLIMIGSRPSAETRLKMRLSRIGKKMSDKTRLKCIDLQTQKYGVKIIVLNKEETQLYNFDSINQASRTLNENGYKTYRANIARCLNGKLKSTCGLVFKKAS